MDIEGGFVCSICGKPTYMIYRIIGIDFCEYCIGIYENISFVDILEAERNNELYKLKAIAVL